MKRKFLSFFSAILVVLGSFTTLGTSLVEAVTELDATQFVSNVTVENSDGGPIGTNKVSDSSTINVKYGLTIGDGSKIDTNQTYTMPLPKELSYETTEPIELRTADGILLGKVTIQNGVISIQFDPAIKELNNVEIKFNFWSKFNKSQLDYDNGNDLAFPTQNDPNNSQHINFSKSGSGGGSGTSAISKNLRYGDPDRTIVTWTVTVNNGGYAIMESHFYDEMENTQEYIPGSMRVNYRNWAKESVRSDTADPIITQEENGKQRFDYSFGQLVSADEKNDQAVTSITLTYQTKLYDNPEDNRFPNTAYSSDGNELIDSVVSTATYQGQGGSGSGDQLTSIEGRKIWQDNENAEQKRPSEITVQLLRDGAAYQQQVIRPNENGAWMYKFTRLPQKSPSGSDYVYTLKEATVPAGYTSKVTGTDITNTYVPETTTISGTKTWVDNNNQEKQRPESITVELLGNGETVASKQVTAQEDWHYEFTQLPKMKNGQPIVYTVKEKAVPNYQTTIQGTNILNTYVPAAKETVTLSGEKIWVDNNDQEKQRPSSITVNVVADGKIIDSKQVRAEDHWKYQFTNLPKKIDGKTVEYSVKENPVRNYETHIEGTTIINYLKHEGTTSVLAKKTWVDQLNIHRSRSDSVRFVLKANGKPIAYADISEKTKWLKLWTDLPVEEEGKKITYKVEEVTNVPGYRKRTVSLEQGVFVLYNIYDLNLPIPSPEQPNGTFPIIPSLPDLAIPKLNLPKTEGPSLDLPDSMKSLSPTVSKLLPDQSNEIYGSITRTAQTGTASRISSYPQTNDRQNRWLIVIGIGLLASVGYGFYRKKKKE